MSKLATRLNNKLVIDTSLLSIPEVRSFTRENFEGIRGSHGTSSIGSRTSSLSRSQSASSSRGASWQGSPSASLSPLSRAAMNHGRSSFFNYVTHASMTDPVSGKEEVLRCRDEVGGIIRKLERRILKPLVDHFGLSYHMFGEHHPNASKAGITHRETFVGGFRWSIRLRVRSRTSPHDLMLSHGTHVAVLLHEVAHLKWMNHSRDFALFLRDIYKYADNELQIFRRPLFNEIPSPWEWEQIIWDTKGGVNDGDLIDMYQKWEDMTIT